MCKLIDEIERALADGRYGEFQEKLQSQRLRVLLAAYERGGEDAVWYADMMFVAGTLD